MLTRAIVLVFLVLTSILSFGQDLEWVVPPEFKRIKNPVESSVSILRVGKSLYNKHCRSCHGKTGLGDGPKAHEVIGDLGDFSSVKFQAQSDGDIYYKSYEGRDFMPSYWKEIPDETDRWSVIHYMRSMGSTIQTNE